MKLRAACLLLSLTLMGAALAAPAPEDAKIDWTVLLQQYRRYGLPLPPPDARLVQVWSFSGIINGRPAREYRCLAFTLPPGSEKARLLVGTEEYQPNGERKVTAADPAMLPLDNVASEWWDPVFQVNAGVATAIQCRERGWSDLAERLLTKSLGDSSGHHFSTFYQPGHEPARLTLARVAWAHYGNELIHPDSDRTLLARQIEDLLRENPELDTEGSRTLLKSVRAALIPSKAPPGSPEARVDALVDLPYRPNHAYDEEPDPHYLELAKLGFAAIPSLIEHLDDERLTRTVRTGFNNFPTYHQTVGMVASELLQHLAGNDLGKDWLRRQQGWNVEKQDARAWWQRARKKGEEIYFAEHVLPPRPKDGFPDEDILRILREMYPRCLPHLYRVIVRERPGVQSWPVARAITRSRLSEVEKEKLFLEAAASANLEHRRAALWELKQIDPERFVRELVRIVDGLPRTPRGSYWDSREGSFASLVVQADDPRAWEALLRAARRADVGLRMEYLNPMNYTIAPASTRRRRLEFLAAFLADATIRRTRDNPEKFGGPYAGMGFDPLEVRNLAAMKLASLLHLEDRPRPDWTDTRWAEFRSQVKQALARELPVR